MTEPATRAPAGVDDKATRLMEFFYKNLREGHGMAQALAMAQAMLRTDPEQPQWRPGLGTGSWMLSPP